MRANTRVKEILRRWGLDPNHEHLRADVSRRDPEDDPFPFFAGGRGVLSSNDVQAGVAKDLLETLSEQSLALLKRCLRLS